MLALVCVQVNVSDSLLLVNLDLSVCRWVYVFSFYVCLCVCLCSTSPSGGNQVEGLPPASSRSLKSSFLGNLKISCISDDILGLQIILVG